MDQSHGYVFEVASWLSDRIVIRSLGLRTDQDFLLIRITGVKAHSDIF